MTVCGMCGHLAGRGHSEDRMTRNLVNAIPCLHIPIQHVDEQVDQLSRHEMVRGDAASIATVIISIIVGVRIVSVPVCVYIDISIAATVTAIPSRRLVPLHAEVSHIIVHIMIDVFT